MLEKIRQKNYRKQIDKALSIRDVSQRNGEIKTLAFLYDGTVMKSVLEMKKIANVLHISERDITFLSFVTFDKKKASLPCDQFCIKDLSWSGKLRRSEVIDFVEKPFDALVCFQDGAHQIIDIIAAKSVAKFKIGLSGSDSRIHDLMIGLSSSDPDKIAEEIKKYLTVLGKL